MSSPTTKNNYVPSSSLYPAPQRCPSPQTGAVVSRRYDLGTNPFDSLATQREAIRRASPLSVSALTIDLMESEEQRVKRHRIIPMTLTLESEYWQQRLEKHQLKQKQKREREEAGEKNDGDDTDDEEHDTTDDVVAVGDDKKAMVTDLAQSLKFANTSAITIDFFKNKKENKNSNENEKSGGKNKNKGESKSPAKNKGSNNKNDSNAKNNVSTAKQKTSSPPRSSPKRHTNKNRNHQLRRHSSSVRTAQLFNKNSAFDDDANNNNAQSFAQLKLSSNEKGVRGMQHAKQNHVLDYFANPYSIAVDDGSKPHNNKNRVSFGDNDNNNNNKVVTEDEFFGDDEDDDDDTMMNQTAKKKNFDLNAEENRVIIHGSSHANHLGRSQLLTNKQRRASNFAATSVQRIQEEKNRKEAERIRKNQIKREYNLRRQSLLAGAASTIMSSSFVSSPTKNNDGTTNYDINSDQNNNSVDTTFGNFPISPLSPGQSMVVEVPTANGSSFSPSMMAKHLSSRRKSTLVATRDGEEHFEIGHDGSFIHLPEIFKKHPPRKSHSNNNDDALHSFTARTEEQQKREIAQSTLPLHRANSDKKVKKNQDSRHVSDFYRHLLPADVKYRARATNSIILKQDRQEILKRYRRKTTEDDGNEPQSKMDVLINRIMTLHNSNASSSNNNNNSSPNSNLLQLNLQTQSRYVTQHTERQQQRSYYGVTLTDVRLMRDEFSEKTELPYMQILHSKIPNSLGERLVDAKMIKTALAKSDNGVELSFENLFRSCYGTGSKCLPVSAINTLLTELKDEEEMRDKHHPYSFRRFVTVSTARDIENSFEAILHYVFQTNENKSSSISTPDDSSSLARKRVSSFGDIGITEEEYCSYMRRASSVMVTAEQAAKLFRSVAVEQAPKNPQNPSDAKGESSLQRGASMRRKSNLSRLNSFTTGNNNNKKSSFVNSNSSTTPVKEVDISSSDAETIPSSEDEEEIARKQEEEERKKNFDFVGSRSNFEESDDLGDVDENESENGDDDDDDEITSVRSGGNNNHQNVITSSSSGSASNLTLQRTNSKKHPNKRRKRLRRKKIITVEEWALLVLPELKPKIAGLKKIQAEQEEKDSIFQVGGSKHHHQTHSHQGHHHNTSNTPQQQALSPNNIKNHNNSSSHHHGNSPSPPKHAKTSASSSPRRAVSFVGGSH